MRYNKFFVLKTEDIEHILSPDQQGKLREFSAKIAAVRYSAGKEENCYFVVNQDEPYAKCVWELIKLGEHPKEIKKP